MRLKTLALIGLAILMVAAAGLFVWARSVLGNDQVRRAVESQLSSALGQPVTIGRLSVGLFPRLTLTMHEVGIGEPRRVRARTLDLGTDLRALLSRRIEHGTVAIDGAMIELPLPPFAFAQPGAAGSASRPPVEIVSVDAITFTNVEILSGGRALRGNIDVMPEGGGLAVRRVSLAADGTAFEMHGTIANIAGPAGELTVTAGSLNVLDLLAFISDFSKGFQSGAPSAPAATPMDVRVTIDAARAIVGTLQLETLAGRAHVTSHEISFEPVSFGVFGGKYAGTLAMTLDAAAAFSITASVEGLDFAEVMRFAGSGDTMSGRLSGTIDVRGRGTQAARAMSTARGAARFEVRDGTVAGLGLVRTVVLAGSGRADSRAALAAEKRSRTEPFSTLGASFSIDSGVARTNDLRFESPDVLFAAAGAIALVSQRVDLAGEVQLSDALTKQAGQDLVRYTRKDGRVTLPISVTGTPGSFSVQIDMAAATKRAIANRAAEEVKKALGSIFKRIIK